MTNNSTMQQDTRRLEQALRENASGKPQLLRYDPRSGNMAMIPFRGGRDDESQFGLLNRSAMTQDFGGADAQTARVAETAGPDFWDPNQTMYSYDCTTGEMVETTAESADAPTVHDPVVVGQFGTIMGAAFTSTFGCEVTVASVCESAIDMADRETDRGFGYTLENEGVVRIVRGEADPLAKGRKDEVVFARDDVSPGSYPDNARYVVRIGGDGVARVSEKSAGRWRDVPSVAIIPDRSGLYALGTGLVESSSLKDARALLLGCGSMGGDIAMHLAMAGVGNVTLVDPDRVEASNLSRLRDAVIADVGRRKVDVLEERMFGKNPSCRVSKVAEDITRDLDRMGALLAGIDVAVVSTDNRASRILFSHALHAAGKPCVFTRCSTRAESGDCFISRPGDACYECLYGAIGGAAEEVDDFSSAKKAGRLAAYCTPGDMPDFAILPGISADISGITAFASRLALWELAKAIGDGQFAKFSEEFSAFNYFLFVNRREKYFKTNAWAPFDKSSEKPCPQRWYGAIVSRRGDCACCGGGDDSLDNGDEDAALFESMGKEIA